MTHAARHKSAGVFLALGSAVLFGLWPACVRSVYAAGANPMFAILMTTAARGLAPWVFCLLTKRPVFQTRFDVTMGLRGGFFQAVALMGALGAVAYAPGPVVITICFTHTIMLLFLLAWKGEVKLDVFTVVTTVAALAGLSFVLNLWSATDHVNPIGIGLAFISSVATLSRLYVFGQLTKTKHPAVVGAETFAFAMGFVALTALFKPPLLPHSMEGWGWIFLGSAAFSVATFAMLYSISMIGSFQFSLMSKMEPVFTALFAALLIHETLNATQYAGIVAVAGSLSAYQVVEHRRKKISFKKTGG